MRNYQYLDTAVVGEENVLSIANSETHREQPKLTMSREGAFVNLSASYGPLEVALRLRYSDLERHLARLHPVPGLATTRQINSGSNSFLAVGQTQDGDLVLRPTIVADASGLIVINLVCVPDVRETIFKWLEID